MCDTLNAPGVNDPIVTAAQFECKIANIARVISDIDPDIIALTEIENRGVLETLVSHPNLSRGGYGIVHYDSPDPRGIDVALLYRSDRLSLVESMPIEAPGHYPTRDILRSVLCTTAHDTITIYALHLPSRRGNSSRAAKARTMITSALSDHVKRDSASAKIIVMGDFNDNPTSRLIRHTLYELHCTTIDAYRRGQGSYAWRDTWQMYDNILISKNITISGAARLFAPAYIFTPSGRFRGYPQRGTFSDHLPVILEIETKKQREGL